MVSSVMITLSCFHLNRLFFFVFISEVLFTCFCLQNPGSLETDFPSLFSEYDPHLLDDPELTSGRHRKVLSLTSYLVRTQVKPTRPE